MCTYLDCQCVHELAGCRLASPNLLLTVQASTQRAAELSAQAAAGAGDPALLAAAVRTEWGGLWIILGLSIANIVLAVWRPRLSRKPAREPDDAPTERPLAD